MSWDQLVEEFSGRLPKNIRRFLEIDHPIEFRPVGRYPMLKRQTAAATPRVDARQRRDARRTPPPIRRKAIRLPDYNPADYRSASSATCAAGKYRAGTSLTTAWFTAISAWMTGCSTPSTAPALPGQGASPGVVFLAGMEGWWLL